MKRVGITQRVFERPDRGEIWDCLDQRLTALAQSIGFIPVPLSNVVDDIWYYWTEMSLDGMILSGGNDLTDLPGRTDASAARDRFETALIDICCTNQHPIFGICRGMQLLNRYFGGTLVEDATHVARRHNVSPLREAPDSWPSKFSVNSFHRWTIPDAALAPSLLPLARADDGTIEAARHNLLPIACVMWHPERETRFAEEDTNLMKRLLNGDAL